MKEHTKERATVYEENGQYEENVENEENEEKEEKLVIYGRGRKPGF